PTATHALYTLSLHDALPISGTRAYGEVSFQIVRRPCLIGIDNQLGFRGRLTHGGDAHRIVIAAELDLQKRPVRRLGGRRRHYLRDRKSTRLNSSHRTSSYAV